MEPVTRPPPWRYLPWAISAAWVEAHTVRKQSTWRQRPAATAMAAAMTDPPGPGRSSPPLCQVGWMRSASSISGGPPSLMPPPDRPPG